jgi:hypothetical protein
VGQFLIILAVLLALVFFVSAPLRRLARPGGAEEAAIAADSVPGAAEADLQAAREAKYREILDAELDFRTGKLSEEDYRQVDAALRAEAVEILNALDREQTRAGHHRVA